MNVENALTCWEESDLSKVRFDHHEGHLVDATLLTPPGATSAVFDDPNLVSSAGLVPVMALARRCGLHELADQHLSVPTDKGANAGLKVSSLVAGMVAGADSIDDMALLRHGGMGTVFDRRLCALDAGLVPAGVHLRPRPPARRGRLPVPDAAGRADTADRCAGIDERGAGRSSTTRSSRSTATPSRARATATPGSAG